MDSNPICHPLFSQKKKQCFFLGYVQLLMIGWAGRWTRTPSTTLLQQKNKMLIFGLCSVSDDRPGCSMDSNSFRHPSSAKKIKMLVFGLCSTSDDRLGWSMDSNLICYPSPAKKIKYLFLDYVQLLMIGWAG